MNRHKYLTWGLPAPIGSRWIEKLTGREYEFSGYEERDMNRLTFEPKFEQSGGHYTVGTMSFPESMLHNTMKRIEQ